MNRRTIAASLAVALATSAVSPMTAQAASSFDMKKKVVGVAGIMNVTDIDAFVTRAEFARMLVNASSFRSTVGGDSNISVFSDVDRSSEYAAYIRTAVEQGWMSAYLGGLFKPDEYITLQEGAKAVLALLGYDTADFAGNQVSNRMAKFEYLELNDGIGRESAEVLTKSDCINLFYNLLKTNTKENEGKTAGSGTIYGSVLNCTLTSDGEINPLEMLDSTLKGPKAILHNSLRDVLPFSPSQANLFLNGEASTAEAIEADENTVVYYNTASKTVWAYNDGGEYKGAATGEIENIYYKSSDVMVPSSVVIDGREYKLESSDMQFAFSLYGDVRVGDEITVVWEKAESGEGDETFTIVDYLD